MDKDDASADVTQLETELEEALAALDEEIRQHAETQQSLAKLTKTNNELRRALANAESRLTELERSSQRQDKPSDDGKTPQRAPVDGKHNNPITDPQIIADTSIGWLARGDEVALERLHDESLPAAARIELLLDAKPEATERELDNQPANELASRAKGRLTIFELIDTSGRPYDEAAQLIVDLIIGDVIRLQMKTSSSGVLL